MQLFDDSFYELFLFHLFEKLCFHSPIWFIRLGQSNVVLKIIFVYSIVYSNKKDSHFINL